MKEKVQEYFKEQLKISEDALSQLDKSEKSTPEINRIREIEAIKLRDRVHQLKRHAAVIKKIN